MIIGEKDIKEIVVTNKSNELIISITDNDIISKANYSVELIQDCCQSCLSGLEGEKESMNEEYTNDKRIELINLMFNYLKAITDTDKIISGEAIESVPEIARIIADLIKDNQGQQTVKTPIQTWKAVHDIGLRTQSSE